MKGQVYKIWKNWVYLLFFLLKGHIIKGLNIFFHPLSIKILYSLTNVQKANVNIETGRRKYFIIYLLLKNSTIPLKNQ